MIGAIVLVAVLATAPPAAPTLEFKPVAPGVWKATVGSPEDLTLLTAAGAQPDASGLGRLPRAEFPFPANAIHASTDQGHVALRFPLALDEDVYGLGVDFKSMRRTGSTFQLHVDHWGGVPGRTHAPVPFYVSTKGYGVFVDASRYITVSVGVGVRLAATAKPPVVDRTTHGNDWAATPRSDAVEMRVPAPGVDVYVFAGPTMMDAVRRFNLFCGGGALPPKWGLGFMTRTPLAYTASQVLDEIAAFRSRGIPLDMIGLEPGWHDHAYPTSFEWDPMRFPNPAELPRQARSAPRPSQSLVQPLRVADGSALCEAAAVRGFASGLEWHRARLLDAGGADGLCRSLALEDRRTRVRRVGRIQDRRGGWLRLLALARPGRVPVRS